MNPRQLGALWIGISPACLLLLFPPQVMMPSMSSVLKAQIMGTVQASPAVRYAFLFAPPAGSIGIDPARLLIPVAVIALLTLGAVLTLGAQPARVAPGV